MQAFPNEGALRIATLVQTYLATSLLRLFKSDFVPSVASTLAEFTAAEADFTGYAEGTLTAWLAPVLNPAGGASIDSPTIQFAAAAPYTVGNVIGGWYIVDAGETQVVAFGTFGSPIPIGAAGQGFPMNVTLVFPNAL
jgi:hypothetical protein